MTDDRPDYATLSPRRQTLYREYVSRHGCAPDRLGDLDQVAQVLFVTGVCLATDPEEEDQA